MEKKDLSKIKWGEIYTCDLGTMKGSVQCGVRPVLVVQTNKLNCSSPTVVVAVITSVRKREDIASHEDRRLNAQRFEEAFYQHKELSESSAEKLKSDTQNTHSDGDCKPPQDGGITDETMLNYLINNPEFLQKFKALLGV